MWISFPLYSLREFCERSVGGSATVLGIRLVSSSAGTHCEQPPRRARHLCGHADGRRKVALLPTARAGAGQNGGGGLAPYCADAGPGGGNGGGGDPCRPPPKHDGRGESVARPAQRPPRD